MKLRVVWNVYYLAVKWMCNTNCAFCNFYEQKNHPDTKEHLKELQSEVDRVYGDGYRKICIWVDGYEPTMFPYFLEILEYIYEKGIEISLNSNGVLFASMAFARRASEYLSKIYITLYAANDREHFLYTQKKQSYKVKLKAIENCLHTWIQVQASVLLLKTNISHISWIIESTRLFWNHPKFVKKINLIEPSCQMGKTRNKGLVPKYGELIGTLNQLVLNDVYRWVKIQLSSSIPQCILKYLDNPKISTNFWWSFALELVFIDVCNGCKYRKKCSGIDSNYLSAFWENEFVSPRDSIKIKHYWEDDVKSTLIKAKQEILWG